MARSTSHRPVKPNPDRDDPAPLGQKGWFAGIPNWIKAVAAVLGLVLTYHVAAMDAARAPFKGDVLQAQRDLGSVSKQGTYYSAPLKEDPEFQANLKVLFNANNDFAGSWFIYDPWATDLFKCPFLKQYRQFVLGESEPGSWVSEEKFLDANSIIASREYFQSFDDADRIQCMPSYPKIASTP